MNPDCLAGKHPACNGDGWDYKADGPVACRCACHSPSSGATDVRSFIDKTIDNCMDFSEAMWRSDEVTELLLEIRKLMDAERAVVA